MNRLKKLILVEKTCFVNSLCLAIIGLITKANLFGMYGFIACGLLGFGFGIQLSRCYLPLEQEQTEAKP